MGHHDGVGRIGPGRDQGLRRLALDACDKEMRDLFVAYFELHIEQGPLLGAVGIAVGVVTHGYATRGMRLRITGETARTGPTPMDQRRNALVGAAYLIAAVNGIGWKYHPEGGKCTASQIETWPNAVGILPVECAAL